MVDSFWVKLRLVHIGGPMSGQLENRVAIITGAGEGIGRGIANAFIKEGAKIVIAEINSESVSYTHLRAHETLR